MRPRRTKKNNMVCNNRPRGVAQPPFDIVIKEPNIICVILYVSGQASKKKTRAL